MRVGVYLGAHNHHRYSQVVCERAVAQWQQYALLILTPPLRGAVFTAAWFYVLLELFNNCTFTQKRINQS